MSKIGEYLKQIERNGIIYKYQLTNYYPLKSDLNFAEEQLRENGAVEGEDYVWHQIDNKEAIWTKGENLIARN